MEPAVAGWASAACSTTVPRSCRDLLLHGPDHAQQRFWPMQVGADAGDGWRRWLSWVRLQPLLQDGLNGSVMRVAIRQRSLASGIQAHLAVLFGQADDALALPQEVQLMLIEQLV